MTAKLQGLSRLEARMRKLAAVKGPVRRRVREALGVVGEGMAAQMRAVAPVASGALKASIKVHFGDYRPDNANVRGAGGDGAGDPDLTMRVVAGDARAWYARLVEFGTGPRPNKGRFAGTLHPGTAPQPFFYPVYRANKRSARARISRAMRAGVQESIR